MILLLCLFLGACGSRNSGNASEEEYVPCSMEQMLLLVASERKQTEDLYTDRIWEVKTGSSGRRYEEAFYDEMKRFFVELTLSWMPERKKPFSWRRRLFMKLQSRDRKL